MSVTLTKILSLFIYPVALVALLTVCDLLLALFRRRLLAILFGFVAFALFMVAATPAVGTRMLASLEQQYPQQAMNELPAADAIVVLGGALGLPLPPRQYTQLVDGSDRLFLTARLYEAGKAPNVIITGGNVFPQEGMRGEAWYASQVLEGWGIPRSRLITETRSRNTYENAVNTRPLLTSLRAKRILLVTSGYHMPRAHGVFTRALDGTGIEIVPVAADIKVTESDSPAMLAWLPGAGALVATTIAIHEYAGQYMYEWRGWM